jgi:hypothetical protein
MTAMQHSAARPQQYANDKVRTRQFDGDWDYFPHGWLGRGYRVDAVELARLVRLEKAQVPIAFVIWICASVLLAFFLPAIVSSKVRLFGVFVAACLIATIWFRITVARRARRLQPAERALTWIELRRWEATTFSNWRIAALVGAVAVVMAAGALLLAGGIGDNDPEFQLLAIVIGPLALAASCYGLAKVVCVLILRHTRR